MFMHWRINGVQKMSTEKFFQLVTIPDYRFSSDKEQCQNIDFDKIATDCDTKTISILQAINHIGVSRLC